MKEAFFSWLCLKWIVPNLITTIFQCWAVLSHYWETAESIEMYFRIDLLQNKILSISFSELIFWAEKCWYPTEVLLSSMLLGRDFMFHLVIYPFGLSLRFLVYEGSIFQLTLLKMKCFKFNSEHLLVLSCAEFGCHN